MISNPSGVMPPSSGADWDGNNDNVLLGMIYPSKHTGAPGLNETTFTGPSNQVDSGSISSNFSITWRQTLTLVASVGGVIPEYLCM